MSAWAETWAYEQDVTPSGAKFVLVAIASFADEDGYCYPGQETLAHMTGQSERAVRGHAKALEAAHLIRRTPRRKADGTWKSDAYNLLAPPERFRPGKPAADSAGGKISQRQKTSYPAADSVIEPPAESAAELLDVKEELSEELSELREARAPATPESDTTYPLSDADYAFGAERGLTPEQVTFATAQWRDDRLVRGVVFPTAAQREADWRKWIRNETRFLARAGPRQGRIAANLANLREHAKGHGDDFSDIFPGHGGPRDELPSGAVDGAGRALPAGLERSG